jgi:hypothetical protein
MLNESTTLPFVIPNETEPALSKVEGDLQFCRLVLEIFFDKILVQVEVKVCRAYGARTILDRSPDLPAAQFDGRPHGPQSPDRSLEKTFPGRACRTADPSASLGMTKERATLPFVFDAG